MSVLDSQPQSAPHLLASLWWLASGAVTSGVCVCVCVSPRDLSSEAASVFFLERVQGTRRRPLRQLQLSHKPLSPPCPRSPSAPDSGCPGARLGGPRQLDNGPFGGWARAWALAMGCGRSHHRRPLVASLAAARNRSCQAPSSGGPCPGFGLGMWVFAELRGGDLRRESRSILGPLGGRDENRRGP